MNEADLGMSQSRRLKKKTHRLTWPPDTNQSEDEARERHIGAYVCLCASAFACVLLCSEYLDVCGDQSERARKRE